MIWVNGEPSATIPADDRSFQYGDGCFTTILTATGEPLDWALHTQRMQSCLDLLNIASPDWERVKLWVEKAASSALRAGVKLHVSRGSGGRGYSPTGAHNVVVTISSFAYPAHYLNWQQQGVSLGICPSRLGHSPLLAGHKHNNRLEQVLLKAEADKLGHQDALVLDIQDNVIETTMANLFWLKDEVLYTPNLSLCGVTGIARYKVLQEAKAIGLTVNVADYVLADIMAADEVFMTNALLTVAPIINIDHQSFVIGSKTRYFQETLTS